MSLPAEHDIHTAPPALWPQLSVTLAHAFHNDPVFGWLLPDTTSRLAALHRFFAIETRHIVLSHQRSTTTTANSGDTVGTALVLPPGTWRTPLRVEALHAIGYLRIFRRWLPRALGVLTALEREHPRRPHYYLPYIGVRPDSQGHGVGTALLQPILQRCDQEGLPAYLEASSPENARLYRRLGFTTHKTVRPLGCPPIELMTRQPRAAAPPTA